jgi:UDP-N-acetylmuramyl tripeptide synthase
MRLVDSRRLTGPNLLLDGPGAILDIALEGADPERTKMAWSLALQKLDVCRTDSQTVRTAARIYPDGLSVAFTADPDVLYTATEVNEEAFRWSSAVEDLGDIPGLKGFPVEAARKLRESLSRERKPWFKPLATQAAEHDVTLLIDDKRVSVGLGCGSRVWPAEETSEVLSHIPWSELSDIPTALVTGTNGKTTTVRLLGAMVKAAGLVGGVTSTDRVTVGDDVVATGDYSGPNGARTVLRDRRVEMALLEVARGGILRRGLGVPRATAALVTNVANDHLGEFGIFDLEALADTKMVVAKAVSQKGRVVLNAEDSRLLERGSKLSVPVIWFTTAPMDHDVADHRKRGGEACIVEGKTLVYCRGQEKTPIADVDQIPIAFGGAARHNVANALGAIGVAIALGLPIEAIRRGLMEFESTPDANPGRANVWQLSGVTVIVDFAHNPHGLEALAGMAGAMRAARRAIVIGQAGDRDDDAIREFARAAWAMAPDHVFIKEMEVYLRGREPGVIPKMIAGELLRCGAKDAALSHWPSELEAVRAAIEWAREGDLLLLTTHAQRDEVIALLSRLASEGWGPGRPIDTAVTPRAG